MSTDDRNQQRETALVIHNWRRGTVVHGAVRVLVAVVAVALLAGLTFVAAPATPAAAQEDLEQPPASTQTFTADMRDVVLEFADFERELQVLIDTGVVAVDGFNTYFAITDLYSLAGQGPDAVIDVEPGLQRAKWDALGIDDYQFVYRDNCFCGWPADLSPPWQVTVINGSVANAFSVEGGGYLDGVTLQQIFDEIDEASAADPARLTASFDLLYGYPTDWFVDRDELLIDEEFGRSVLSFTPLRSCGGDYWPVDEQCSTVPEIQVDRAIYEGDVACEGAPAIGLDIDILTGNGRTTICYTVTNVGGALAEDVTISDPDYDLAEVNLGSLFPSESTVYRHFVDESTTQFLADMRDVFLDANDLVDELYELVDRGIISNGTSDGYLQITDLYELAGQGPDAVIEVDPDLQQAKWEILGLDDYEFDYRDNCFCYWPAEVAPPWRVQVRNSVVISAVSIEGGGAVEGTTLAAIFDRIELARAGEPFSISASYDLLYGYPTSWYVDRDRRIADEEFGQSVLAFTPLRECTDRLVAVDQPCAGIESTIEIYDGEVDCNAPGSPPLPDNRFLPSPIVTVCVTVTNLGDEAVTDVIVSANDLPFPFEITIAVIAPGETVVERSVIDRRIRSYELEPELPDTRAEIDRQLTELLETNTILAADRDAWFAVSDLNGPVPGESVVQTQINKWNALGLDDYEFTYRQFCFCPPELNEPRRVRVVNGVVVLPVDGQYGLPPTVPEMFDRIDPDSSAFSIAATFDRLYGVPTSWAIDSIELAVDDEVSASISGFVPLVDCNGDLVELGAPCADEPDCADWSLTSRQGPGWWHSCWLEVLREWLRQLDRDWARAWGVQPI